MQSLQKTAGKGGRIGFCQRRGRQVKQLRARCCEIASSSSAEKAFRIESSLASNARLFNKLKLFEIGSIIPFKDAVFESIIIK